MSAVQSFAIIGAGALGAYYGARLVQGGHDVHFLLRSDYDTWRNNGLEIRSWAGDFSLRPGQLHIYRHASQMPQTDWVIVALKSTDNAQFAPLIKPMLGERTALLTLQNGLGNERALADLFGAERVMGGVAFVCVNRVQPGLINHTSHGLIRLGEFTNRNMDRATAVASIFSASHVPCEATDSLVTVRWEKLIWNIPFNGLSAILNQTTEQILSTPEGEQLVRQIMAEVLAVGRACGAKLGDDLIDINLDRTRQMGPYRTSMQIDHEQGREMEIEAILRQPLRAAQEHRLVTPKLAMLCDLACMIDTQKLRK